MTAKKTILIVDDNKLNRSILCKILHSSGYETIEAGNGQEALDILCDSIYSISLVLLDIVMPLMDGYTFLDKMNETGIINSVPVIVTTSSYDNSNEIRCLEQGASDFLKKPYNAELVCHRVKSMLRLWDNAALINQVETDKLTGVYNKEFFYYHTEAELDAHPDYKYYIIYTDIDDFKMINSHYGMETGDVLLKYLAGILQKMGNDNEICGRIGADTFAMLRRDCEIMTQKEVEQLYKDMFDKAPVKGFQLKIGIYPITNRSIPVSEMCDRAKLAEASIKHKYGMFYAVYNDSMLERAMREHRICDSMEMSLEKKEFQMYLQPKHSTQSGKISGAEALVRWNHPELGFISPGDFIPLFERNGFIAKLDAYMLNEVCLAIVKWKENGIVPVPISVNVSRANFTDSELAEKISRCVDKYNIEHELIHLEITESAYTDNPKQIISVVSTLRDMGFLIEMDDFGSGYSSLNMLSELPIDILKLDMRFMQSGNERIKGGKRNILSFIVSLSKWLQLPTIAEGVETEDEYELLKSMGCNFIQGFYFAKPMPENNFAKYLSEHPGKSDTELKQKSPSAWIEENIERNINDRQSVLVVEDIESNREIMKELLSPYYNVTAVENGKEACDYLTANSSVVSCILLDLLMPVMDGFQVLENMQANGLIDVIPVIITTETGSNSELRALHLGADSFVAKPYNPEILLHHVKKAIEQKNFWKIKREFEFLNTRLSTEKYCDETTELLNRYGLREALEILPADEYYTAIMFDIDNLKKINDEGGRMIGDEIILAVTKILKKETRNGDILARIGADEFFVVLRGMNDQKTALTKGQTICSILAGTEIRNTGAYPVCSAGVTIVNRSEKFEKTESRLKTALMRAKLNDKGNCILWVDQAEENTAKSEEGSV